jgi:zinc protease
MKTKLFFTAIFSFMSLTVFSNEAIKSSIKKFNWNGVEVVYLEDNRFPTYDMVVYFADGALSDGEIPGETEHAFNLIDSGTSKLTQKEILDQIDFLGTELGSDTTHEYTTLAMAGLAKDFNGALKDTCHLLRDGTYPNEVVQKELDKERSGYRAFVSNPQALADRANREITMSGTPYSYPVSGKLKDLDKISTSGLRSKMDYFLNKVKKRIYLTGPKSILEIEKVFKNDCKFAGNDSDFVRKATYQKVSKNQPEIIFVPIPDANQVQVRIGRFLNRDEINDRNLDALATDLLGGGFTSKLMREVRVKRGLTYSIGSYISSQKEYGRAGISTFTKNETINRLVEVISDTVLKIKKSGITKEDLERTRMGLLGSHPFKFESNKAFLLQLLYLDHVEKDYDELFSFSSNLSKYNATDVEKKINDIYGLSKQTIFILGDKSLEKELKKLPKKYGRMKVLDYNLFI